jgi:HAD superfamily hydrolase (TIGR01549 family)
MLNKWAELRRVKRSGYFDKAYYLRNNPDCRRADIDPLYHFMTFGWREGRNPSSKFDTNYYLAMNPDIRQTGYNPLLHYLRHGKEEGRRPCFKESFKQSFESESNRFKNNLIDIQQIQPAKESGGKVAIHIHVFYHDLIEEFVWYLKNMPFHYDLFISVVSQDAYKHSQEAFQSLPKCLNVNIEMVSNRGRDIAPFLCTFGKVLSRYDYIAHLHTKKSLYNNDATKGWREYLCGNLFGSQDRIRRIFTLMQGEDFLGIVYPQNSILLPHWANTWLANKASGFYWCSRLGIIPPQGYFDYPAGSMFWASSLALSPIFNMNLVVNDFPIESGQTDGTLAHTLERLFGIFPQKYGLKTGILKDNENESWSAWRFDQYIRRSEEDKVGLMHSDDVKLIAFDIFDTLLTRPLLDPETIKKIVARWIGSDFGALYIKYRERAEQLAREAKGLDVGLSEIYTCFGELTGLSESRIRQIQQVEEMIELNSLQPRIGAVELFREAVDTGKPVIIISDMFLSRNILEKLLLKNGFKDWQALFVSNEIGFRKDTGKLYQHVLEEYQVDPSNMLMIGDNERSDIQIPSDMGARVIHFLRPIEFARGLQRFKKIISEHEHKNELNAEVTLGLILRKNFSPLSYSDFDPDSLIQPTAYNFGYSLVGPLLVSFSNWLYKQALKDGIQRLYFLSREGKVMKKIFDIWNNNSENSLTSEYVVISRRAASVAAIASFENIVEIASKADYSSNTVEKFLYTRYGLVLSDARWIEIFNSLNLKQDTMISIEQGRIDHLKPLLNLIKVEIFDQAQKEKKALRLYLKSLGLDSILRQAVVDVGYSGSIQGYLSRLLPPSKHGYYLMTDQRSRTVTDTYGVFAKGCFFEDLTPTPDAPSMYIHSFLIEKLLSTNDAQVEYYEIDSTGTSQPKCRDLLCEEAACEEIKNQLSVGAMDFTIDALQVRKQLFPDFQPSCWTAQMLLESFFDGQSLMEKNCLSEIITDDFYCGRDLVS